MSVKRSPYGFNMTAIRPKDVPKMAPSQLQNDPKGGQEGAREGPNCTPKGPIWPKMVLDGTKLP